MVESAQQITQNYVVDKRRVCECTIRGCSTFCRRFHLQSHDTKQLSTGFSNKGVTTRMTAFTNMFLKMHLIRSARGRHASTIFASHAARASQGIIPSHSTSVGHPRALREPSAASPSRCRPRHLASVVFSWSLINGCVRRGGRGTLRCSPRAQGLRGLPPPKLGF